MEHKKIDLKLIICRHGRSIFVVSLLLFNLCFFVFYTHTAHAAALGNLAGYWKLDETTAGATAIDSSGNNNNLTPSGSPQPSTSVPSNISFPDSRSLSFNGSNTLEEANPTGLNYGSAPRSISAWIYPTVDPTGGEVPAAYGACAYGGVSTNQGMEFGFFIDSSMDLHFWGCGSYDFDTNHTVTLDQWSNVTITYDGSTVTVYLNGVNVGSQARTLVNQGASTPYMEIGSASLMDGVPDSFTGNVDDVRVYTRALSSTEVSEIASTGNTVATWTGNSSTNWQNSANWNINAVPDGYTNIIVGNGTYQPELTAPTSVSGLVINAGSSLNLNGQNLSMNDSGNFTNNGTLMLQGVETITSLANDSSSGTVEYDGNGTYSLLNFGYVYHNLLFNGTGSWTLSSPLTVNNNLNIASGTLSSGGNNITLDGNWANTGTYNADNNTVILNGNDQTINGSTTFYNLTKATTNGSVLIFQAGNTQTVTNMLTLTGTSGNLLALQSTLSGTQWRLNLTGSSNLNYLAVQDSNNLGAILNPPNSLDDGDNLNWFPPYKPTALGSPGYVGGSYTNNSSPTLSFNLSNSDTLENLKYQVEVASNNSFTGPLIDFISAFAPQGSSSFSVGQPTGSGSYITGSAGQILPAGSYYWRVQMIDSAGNSSGYTMANNGAVAFIVDTTPPTVPGQPSTTSPTTTGRPVWTWVASTDSGSGLVSTPYTVEWSPDATFTSDVSSTTSSTNSLTLPVTLTPGTWYIRVKAEDVAGNVSAYSLTGSVTITSSTMNTNIGDEDTDDAAQTTTASVNVNSRASSKLLISKLTNTKTNSSILLNDYSQYASGEGKQFNLKPNQVVYFKVGSQTHSITVDTVAADQVTLTLHSTPRTVTIQTGDTDEYDVDGDGRPDIKITLLGIRDGVAQLSFAQVGQATVNLNLSRSSQLPSGLSWLIVLLIGIVLGMWIMWRWKRLKSNK